MCRCVEKLHIYEIFEIKLIKKTIAVIDSMVKT